MSSLNESPYEKAGKYGIREDAAHPRPCASMKVPTKKQGNQDDCLRKWDALGLNESPYEKAGKSSTLASTAIPRRASMKVPTKKQGNNGHSVNRYRTP